MTYTHPNVDTRPLPVALCVDGLIEHLTADGPEFWACHGCPGCPEAVESR
jgi:hypothetical protein